MLHFSGTGKEQRTILSSSSSSHRPNFMSVTQATSWGLHSGRPPVLCLVQPQLGHNRNLEPLSFAWASTWGQTARQRRVCAAMRQSRCLPESLLQTTNCFLTPNNTAVLPPMILWKWVKKQTIFHFLDKTNEPGSNWKMLPDMAWPSLKCYYFKQMLQHKCQVLPPLIQA